jgi:alkylhydroperoxidase/carboxymuconolactone decarboxylase family protein YurZ
MDNKQAAADELLERMKRGRGYTYRAWEYGTHRAPEFFETYARLADFALLHEPETAAKAVLAPKMREFIALGILAFRGREHGVRQHMRRARRLGATEQELLELAQTVAIPGGSPSMVLMLDALAEILEEEAQARPNGEGES